MPKAVIPNVLGQRYATPEMCDIWSEVGKIIAERELWIAIMEVQLSYGVAGISREAIAAYTAQAENVDLEEIERIERTTKHDVKARIEAFNALAGYDCIHIGMTSRDLTENIEQAQILNSLKLLRLRVCATLLSLTNLIAEYSRLVMAGRSHNVAAQPTTFGKRVATCCNELLIHAQRLQVLIDSYPMRGLKGPMGTSQDMLDLLEGNEDNLQRMELLMRIDLGFADSLESVGQVYPRSLDVMVLSLLVDLSSAPSNFATQIRLMAGHELATEGFKEGQVGSSAMPHKMNARTCERINGFAAILPGYVTMMSTVAGHQWNEGDVSCSVVRRVALPDAFFAIDGLFQSFLTVLNELGVYPAVIEAELQRYLPFLTTTALMMVGIRKGMGRDEVHSAIKKHALPAALRMREEGGAANDFFDRLAADPELPFEEAELTEILQDPIRYVGDALGQTSMVHDMTHDFVFRYCPEAYDYRAGDIL